MKTLLEQELDRLGLENEHLPFDELDAPYPKPFDNLGISASDVYRRIDELNLSLVERLEAYEPKSRLMLYALLDSAGIRAARVRRDAMNIEYHTSKDMTWSEWKYSVSQAAGKSWPECAELIYGDMF